MYISCFLCILRNAQYMDLRNPMLKVRVPLQGCRAAMVPKDAMGPTCFWLKCTATQSQLNFCGQSVPQAQEWVSALNRASHPAHTAGHYEVAIKASTASTPTDSARREREWGVLEDTAFREAWVHTYLSALPLMGASPHFPRFYSHTRCTELPARWTRDPADDGVPAGVLPSTLRGAALPAAVAAARTDGAKDRVWSAVVMETYTTDLQAVLDAYAGPVLTNVFVRSLLLQVIHAVGVARHAFGFHHNDLMALKHIKLYQVPQQSRAYRPYACYVVKGNVLGGGALTVPAMASSEQALPFLYLDSGGDAAGGACARRGEEPAPGQSGGGGASQKQRTSWCVGADDADGLVVKLHNFGASALTRKQLEWWNAGYTFPNPAWRDDLRDFALAACGVLAEKVDGGLHPAGVELCAAMQNGQYRDNPIGALRHAFFEPLRTVTAVPGRDRNTYRYEPSAADPSAGAASGARKPAGLALPAAGDATSAAILRAIVPPPPTVQFQSPLVVKVAWAPHAATADAPQPRPDAYSLLVNGVSMYSGVATQFVLPLKHHGCAKVAVAAFYKPLGGWTPASAPTAVNC